MGTPENLKERSIEARRKLIEEGAPCYLDAWVALNEFCGVVQRRLTGVLRGRLPILSKVLGLKLAENQIRPEAWPEKVNQEGFTGNEAFLGVRLRFPDQHLDSLYVGLAWEEEAAEGVPIWVQAGISAKSKAALEKAWTRFQGLQAEKIDQGGLRDIYFWSEVPVGKLSEFQGLAEKKLDDLIHALKEAGGLEAFLT